MVHTKLAGLIEQGIPYAKNQNIADYELLHRYLQNETPKTLLISMYIYFNEQLQDNDRLKAKLAGFKGVEESLVAQYNELVQKYNLLLKEKQSLKDKVLRLGGQINGTGRIQKGETRAYKKGSGIMEILYLQNNQGMSDDEICAELGISKTTLWRRRSGRK